MAKPIATWNPEMEIWTTIQSNLLSEPSALWQAAWPTSGMTVDGQLLKLQMQAHRTSEIESTLLPTPAVAHVRNHDEDVDKYIQRRRDYIEGRTKGMPGASLGVAVRLIEEGRDWKDEALLPTPLSRDYKEGYNPHIRDGKVQVDNVPRAILHSQEVEVVDGVVSWGKFEPAIRRWEEVTGRAAPEPTKPDGVDGKRRLNSAFVEWLMGLEAGWITGAGIKRTDELKACGNGVVPQAAEIALKQLLNGVEW